MSILKTKKIFTYMVVGALVSALFISCGKNPSEPGTEGNGGADSVPTFTGDPLQIYQMVIIAELFP